MTEQPNEKRGRKQGRSPSYPGIDLKTAIERAEIIKKEEGRHTAPADVIIGHWGYAPKSGPGLITLAALKKFGLLEDEGTRGNQQLRLTDLAWKILLDDEESLERLDCIRKAALMPTIHDKLWTIYDGPPPSDQNLRRRLLFEEKFTESAVDEFIDQFKRTILFAKLTEDDIISWHEEDKTELIEERAMPNIQNATFAEGQTRISISAPAEITAPMQEFNMALSDGRAVYLRVPHSLTRSDWRKIEKLLKVLEPDEEEDEAKK